MPDTDHSNPDDPTKSGSKLKAVIPHTPGKTAKLTVEAGTHEHRALLEETESTASEQQTERRKQQPQLVINQAPPSGGLMGKWANIANMSAVGLIMAVFVWILFSVRADERERRSIEREDRINDRSQTQAAFASLTATLATMTSRNDTRDMRIDAMLEESRLSRNEMKQTQQEMLSVLKAILAKNNPMGPPEETMAAPMPRAGRGQAG
jgi:hypothetical protein